MSEVRSLAVLVHHTYRLWRAGQLRFRLETFGLYYPSPAYAAPWWKISPRAAFLLMRQAPAYARWLSAMKEAGPALSPDWVQVMEDADPLDS